MSSIPDQHKIHRHSREHPIEHHMSDGIHEKQLRYQDDILVSSAPNSAEFSCGVTPASVEAAVRAAPSPIIPHKSRNRTFSRSSWASGIEHNVPHGSPRPSYKGVLTPFSAFKSVPTNEADYQVWRKSQSSRRNQRSNSSTSIHQSTTHQANFDGRNHDPNLHHHRIPPSLPHPRHHLHHTPTSNYFPAETNQRKQEVEAICLDLLRRFQHACRYVCAVW